MTSIHPQPCNKVIVNIAEQEEKKQSIQNPIQTTDLITYKQIFGSIILCITVFIVGCELVSFGLKNICTISDNAILYRYQTIGSCLMIIIGSLGLPFTIIWLLCWLKNKPAFTRFIYIVCRCIDKDTSSAISWWSTKRFARIVCVICLVLIWLAMFEIAHTFYVTADYIKTKPIWSQSTVYFAASAMIFGIWWFIFTWLFFILIMKFVLDYAIGVPLLYSNTS